MFFTWIRHKEISVTSKMFYFMVPPVIWAHYHNTHNMTYLIDLLYTTHIKNECIHISYHLIHFDKLLQK